MSNNMNLFSGNVCRKVITEALGTIKSSNFPLPYPDNADCVWIIILKEISEIAIELLVIDLSPTYILKITACGSTYTLPIKIVTKCKSFEVVFRTGKNKYRNCGFLLKYYSYENPKTFTASSKSAKTVVLKTKGMYVEYVILIIALQNSLLFALFFAFQKNSNENLHLKLVIKSHLHKGGLEGMRVSVVCSL